MTPLLICLLGLLAADGDNWPAFLGAGAPQPPADSLPLTWSPESNIAWTAQLPGQGQSSPVVWDGKVYVTTIEGANKEASHVVALDLKTGKELWRHTLKTSFPVEVSVYVSQAAPTPVVDSSGVIAFFEAGDLVALDHAGQVRWQRSLSKEFGQFKNRFGLAGSLAQDENAIYVLVDDEGPSYLMAIAKKTGETLWKKDREPRVSWSSPMLVRVGDKMQLVVSSAGAVDAYAPADGEVLWTKSDVGGNTVCTPLDDGEGRILIGASPGERSQYANMAPKSNIALQLSNSGEPKTLWTAPRGAMASFASPVIHQGCAYWVTRAGVVFCLDAKTGEQLYSDRIADSCWATPLGVGDRIYFFGRGGKTTVLAAGPAFKELAVNSLWSADAPAASGQQGGGNFGGRTLYAGVAVNGSLLLREGEKLHCVRK